MNTEPYGTTVFCDDIRREINGKLTLVGCYGSELNFSSSAPGVLPTFAALVNVRVPRTLPVKSLTLRVIKWEGQEKTQLLDAVLEVQEEGGDSDQDEEKLLHMTIPLQWSHVPFKEDGEIRVRAYLDGKREVRLGALQVNFRGVEQETAAEN